MIRVDILKTILDLIYFMGETEGKTDEKKRIKMVCEKLYEQTLERAVQNTGANSLVSNVDEHFLS